MLLQWLSILKPSRPRWIWTGSHETLEAAIVVFVLSLSMCRRAICFSLGAREQQQHIRHRFRTNTKSFQKVFFSWVDTTTESDHYSQVSYWEWLSKSCKSHRCYNVNGQHFLCFNTVLWHLEESCLSVRSSRVLPWLSPASSRAGRRFPFNLMIDLG